MVNFINRNPKINLSLHSCGEIHVPMAFVQWAAGFHLLIMSYGSYVNIQNWDHFAVFSVHIVSFGHILLH